MPDEWLVARKKLFEHEKELSKHHDRVNAERRRLPMVKIEKDYVFEGPNGVHADALERRARAGSCDCHDQLHAVVGICAVGEGNRLTDKQRLTVPVRWRALARAARESHSWHLKPITAIT